MFGLTPSIDAAAFVRTVVSAGLIAVGATALKARKPRCRVCGAYSERTMSAAFGGPHGPIRAR